VVVDKKADADDDRPPICPACGVTMGITIDEDRSTRYVCLECGFSDDSSKGSEGLSISRLATQGDRGAASGLVDTAGVVARTLHSSM
jgi:hypothetical protein